MRRVGVFVFFEESLVAERARRVGGFRDFDGDGTVALVAKELFGYGGGSAAGGIAGGGHGC